MTTPWVIAAMIALWCGFGAFAGFCFAGFILRRRNTIAALNKLRRP